MTTRDCQLRLAREEDLPEILDIVNHNIAHSDALWNNTPQTLAQRAAWLKQQQENDMPVFVVICEGTFFGYGSYGPFRPYEGYAQTVEHSIYVKPGMSRLGIGQMILTALITHATEAGRHVMIGAITDTNTASIQLHEKFGFTAMPAIPEVGRKFDRWLNLVFMYRILDS